MLATAVPISNKLKLAHFTRGFRGVTPEQAKLAHFPSGFVASPLSKPN